MKTFLMMIPFVAATALAQTAPVPAPETISVSGTGRVTLQPDRYTFTVGVQTQAATVEDAVSENNSRVAAVVAALKKAGAADADVRTSGFSIYPQQDYSQQGKPPRVVGYQVTNNITVTRKQASDAGRLLQAAINAGVNTASSLSFDVSDPRRGRDEGLRAAFDDARAKASILAAAAGRTLGRAMAITEGVVQTAPPPRPMMRGVMAAKAEVSEVPVESGSQEQTFSVSVVFELR